jgi:RNA polymerase sigma-70 factor (ECF subfamily)
MWRHRVSVEDFGSMVLERLGRSAMSDEPEAAGTLDERALVRAAQRGDRTSFGQLYDRYARMVHGLLLSKVPFSEADDLTQEVFLKALRQLASLREVAKFGGWLAAIARNLANDYHRRAVPEEAIADDASEGEVHPTVDSADLELSGERVLAAVKSLPEAYRETLILRLVEGMNGPEIAARTGLTPGSVRVNLHRGMQMLRARLSQNTYFSQQHGEAGHPSAVRPHEERS